MTASYKNDTTNTQTAIKQPTFHTSSPPSKAKLFYDIAMLFAIVIDLIIMVIDLVLMSDFILHLTQWLHFSHPLQYYIAVIHPKLRIAGGIFTLFLISELIIRWIIAVSKKQYLRWFFFPFVHWYEVLGCFPQLRALRLLRAIVIVRRMHQLGYQIIPDSWIQKGKLYYDIVLEEIADRVILTATGHLRQQMHSEADSHQLLGKIVSKNQDIIAQTMTDFINQNLAINQHNTQQISQTVAYQVGVAIQQAITNTPEIHRYTHMIPIAGSLIESQIQTIAQQVGENVVTALTERLTHPQVVENITDTITKILTNTDVDFTQLEDLILLLAEEGLTAFEQQVKVQQWKLHEEFSL
ncbi:hypothetical protein [Psychrobacter sp. I-STPA10]|uniref:hypothetical protein n=1 Tax=Psychrobacter sp. I-STPA10 TaxID=2585769 RepID=UPI001E56AC00|nr:hypothetical protein [Psychrobacter sp. I-STPA10]